MFSYLLSGRTFCAESIIPALNAATAASDMYLKEHITMGTLLAVFIACSDEALPILMTDINKAYLVLPIILIKFILGFVVGFIVDLIIKNSNERVHEHLEHCHLFHQRDL